MKTLVATCLSLSLGLTASVASAGVIMKFSPATQHIEVGETVQVELRISGLDAEVLSAFDLNFVYDASLLKFQQVTTQGADEALAASSGVAPLIALDSVVDGNIGIQGTAFVDDATLAAGQADAFTLFRFDLLGLDNGSTSFTLGTDPDFERNIVGLNFLTLSDVVIEAACVAVGTGNCANGTALPEPGTAGLAMAALAAAVTRRRRADKLS
jgi:MYXO-CTERM domain-containing protein